MAELIFAGRPVLNANVSGGFLEMGSGYPADGHKGVDLACPVGAEITAPAGGQITAHPVDSQNQPTDGWGNGSLGNCIVIDHPGTPWWSFYAHMQSFSPAIMNGAVTATTGMVLGKVGMTGLTSGPHLHWAVCRNAGHSGGPDQFADPLSFIRQVIPNEDPRIKVLEEKVKRLEGIVGGYGLLGPGNTTGKPDLFGEDALNYANQRQFSALAGVQLGGIKDAEIVKQLLLLASGNTDSIRDDLISGITELLAKLEKK